MVLQPTVGVERVLVDARVLDGGRAVPSLRPENFRVRIDGKPAELISVSWMSAEGARPVAFAGRPEGGPEADRTPVHRRLLVFFFQKDYRTERTRGLLGLLEQAQGLVDGMGLADLVAVASFDTHLKLWRDFTFDRDSLHRALEHDVLHEERPRYLGMGSEPSLVAHLSLEDSRRAASPETALRLLAEALGEVEGSKTLVFFGYGFGQLSGPRVEYHRDYEPARRALLEAGVTVFCLDSADADPHSLEIGLQEIAAETGGFYARTHDFARQAMNRLEEALEGHYVLEVAHPGGPRGRHELDVGLVGRGGRVLARKAYFD